MRPVTVTTSNAVAGNVESNWVFFDCWAPTQVTLQVNVTGSATYTVYSTLDDPNDPTNPVPVANVTWIPSSTPALVSANTSQQGSFAYAPKYAKIVQTAGAGSCAATFIQNSNGPR